MALKCPPVNSKRKDFFLDAEVLTINQLTKKYFPQPLVKRIFEESRPLLYNLGILRRITQYFK